MQQRTFKLGWSAGDPLIVWLGHLRMVRTFCHYFIVVVYQNIIKILQINELFHSNINYSKNYFSTELDKKYYEK